MQAESSAAQHHRDKRTAGEPQAPSTPVSIEGTDVEIVRDDKYLGVDLHSRLDWARNTGALYKKTPLPEKAPVTQHLQ